MTDEFKQKLLAYLTGKLKKETGVNEPIYSNIQKTNVGIQTYLNKLGIDQPILWEIIQGKNANGDLLDSFLVVGYDRYIGTDASFFLILDGLYNPIGFINEYSSGAKIQNITDIRVDENGTFYAIEKVKQNDNTYKYRLVVLNNILIPDVKEKKNIAKIRKSYYLQDNLQEQDNVKAIKKPLGNKYLFIGQKSVSSTTNTKIAVEFTINVGSANEWVTYEEEESPWVLRNQIVYWDSEDKLHFRFAEVRLNNAFVRFTENNNETKQIKEILAAYIGVIKTFINAVFLNYDTCYIIALTPVNDELPTNHELKIYRIDIKNDIRKRIYQKIEEKKGILGNSNRITILTDNKNVFVCATVPSQRDNGEYTDLLYMGIIDDYTPYIHNFGEVTEISQTSLFTTTILNNLYSFNFLIEDVRLFATTSYNKNNYNGLSYENINSLVPNKVNLYDENNIEIFSKNLYNVSINSNSSISTVQIGNNELNDNTIEREELIGETNTILNSVNQKITKNIYEKVNINFINNIQIKNANNENDIILNINGASRLNESVLKTIDYDNAKATKIRLIYNDGMDKIFGLADNQIEIIGEKLILYDFVVYNPSNKNIKTIEFISNDEKTTYQKINPNLENNKYYNINQFVKIV